MRVPYSIGLGVFAAAMPISVAAQPLEYGNDSGGSVTAYGQLSPTYLGVDDGTEKVDELADNARSNSRVGLIIDQDFSDLTLSFVFETALGAPQTSGFSQGFEPEWDWQRTNIRRVELIMSGAFGIVSLGQGSMASDGTAGSDLSKTTMASTVTTSDTAGGFNFRFADGRLSSVKLGNVFSDFDGGRRNRIRYETPKFLGGTDTGGLSVAIAYGQEILAKGNDDEFYDIGLFYAEEAGRFRIRGGANYAWVDGATVTESYAASLSVLDMPTGLNGTLAAGGDPDGGSYGYGKLGWFKSLWDGGVTALSVDYYQGRDFNVDGSTSDAWGIQVAQFVDRLSLEAYLGFARASYDDAAGSYDDIDSTLAGVRWRF
ncbi:porin [Rhodobacteraceae bacterium SC52]|nr:porin [Rhodobacteraceae bacterium SC52]